MEMGDGFNLGTAEDMLDFADQLLRLTVNALAHTRTQTQALLDGRLNAGASKSALRAHLETTEKYLTTVAALHAAVSNTRQLRAQLAAAPAGEHVQ